jgi:hypothetical protein
MMRDRAAAMPKLSKWMQDNPLGMGLGALCGVLLFVWLVLAILASMPLSVAPADNAEGAANAGLDLPVLGENQPLDTFAVITERPLFNETRQPMLDDALDNGNLPPEPEEEIELPEVELAGVVITPSLRMATLKRKDNAMSLVAFEGRPIEADFGTWQVSRILPRTVTLSSDSGGELELEMKVHDAKIEPPVRPAAEDQPKSNREDDAGSRDEGAQPLSRAEEIRQRIAERREELRREAEEAGEPEPDNEPPNYQDAIQAMIGRNRRQSSGDENEQ